MECCSGTPYSCNLARVLSVFSSQLAGDLCGVDGIVGDHVQGVAADSDAAPFFVPTGTLPLLRRESRQFGDVLGAEAIEGGESGAQISGGIVAISRPGFLIVGGDKRVIIVAHEPHAFQRTLFSIAQVTDDFDDRPTFVASSCRTGLLLRAAIQ